MRAGRSGHARVVGSAATAYLQLHDDDDEMNDRLAELRGSTGAGPWDKPPDLEAGGGAPPGTSAFMQAFFDDVQVVIAARSLWLWLCLWLSSSLPPPVLWYV